MSRFNTTNFSTPNSVASILDNCYCHLRVLINKSLITVSHNIIEMHDLLQDFGREIVRKQSPTDLGKRSRLWAPEDVQRTLKKNDGTNAVEGIFLDMSKIEDIHLSLEAFNRMYNLRLLKFYNSNKRDNKMYNSWLHRFYPPNKSETRSLNKVHFREGQNDAPPFDKLRSFIWFGYPFAALSSEFNLENLLELDLSCSSNLERLWGDTEGAPKLKWLDLHDCPRLIEVPDLSKSRFLEKIDLHGCSHLTKIQNLSNLALLEAIDLNGCSSLTKIPDLSGSPSLKSIDLSGSPLLKSIDLSDCPKSPDNLGNLNSSLKLRLPCSLTRLYLNDCNLKKIPEEIGCLSSLEFLELSGNNFESLPKSMKQLYNLTSMKVDNCNMLQSLTDLPSALENLSASGCKQLRSIPKASEFANLVKAEFIFSNCLNLEETAVGNMLKTLQEEYEEDEIVELTFFCPGSKVPEWFMYRTEGSSIVEFQMPEHDSFLGFVVCAVIAFGENCSTETDLEVHY